MEKEINILNLSKKIYKGKKKSNNRRKKLKKIK